MSNRWNTYSWCNIIIFSSMPKMIPSIRSTISIWSNLTASLLCGIKQCSLVLYTNFVLSNISLPINDFATTEGGMLSPTSALCAGPLLIDVFPYTTAFKCHQYLSNGIIQVVNHCLIKLSDSDAMSANCLRSAYLHHYCWSSWSMPCHSLPSTLHK